jgi:hypothetical protein
MHVYDGAVSTFYYQPTAADRKQFACPKADDKKTAGFNARAPNNSMDVRAKQRLCYQRLW